MTPTLLLLSLALAQAEPPPSPLPDSEWGGFPGQPSAPPPPPDVVDVLPGSAEGRDEYPVPLRPSVRPRPPAEVVVPNEVSVHSGEALGPGRRALSISVGFPLMGVRAVMGLGPALDVGVSYDTHYGTMHDARLTGRFHLFTLGEVSVAAVADAGAAWFLQPPRADTRGARWLTGRRNFNASAGAVLSIKGDSARAARLFLDGRFHLAADTQPYQRDPLGGLPPPLQLAGNVPVRAGAEIPFSRWTSFLICGGLELHGRSDDSTVMLTLAAGMVTVLP